ncbi:unnamed protein product, partial [Sphacelaria rigidula]
VIVAKLEYAGEVWEGDVKLEKLGKIQMAAAREILGCSKTTSNTVLRAELGVYSLETNGDMRKLRCQYSVKNMQRKRFPAKVDKAVWKKSIKGKAGKRWDEEVERFWKEIRGNQGEILSIGETAGYMQRKGEIGVKRDEVPSIGEDAGCKAKVRDMEAYLHGIIGGAGNLKLRFRVGDLDLPERGKIYTSSRKEEEVDGQNCLCGNAIEIRSHIAAECELYKEERDVLEGEIR